MGKRLFLAVDVDAATRARIGRISEDVRRALRGTQASWVAAERLHLTLHFFADADGALEARLLDALSRPVEAPPFAVVFSGIGWFPERGTPRVVWMALAEGASELQRVRRILAGRIGPDAGRDAFTPHLTLARLRDRLPRGALDACRRLEGTAGPSLVDRVTLYESRRSPKGSAYTRVAEAALTCPPAPSSS